MLNYLTKQLYNRRKRKAVSPVISTIIIVAIAIAISIAVALYLTGVTSTFTRFERLDVTSAYPNPLNALSVSNVELGVKNSGTSTLTIDRVLLNGRPVKFIAQTNGNSTNWQPISTRQAGTTVANNNMTLDGSTSLSIVQGDSGSLTLPIKGISGQSIEIVLHTVSGKEYPKVVVLP